MSEDFYGALMQRRAIANTVDLATIKAPGIYPIDAGNSTAPSSSSGTLLVYLPTAKYKQEFIPDSGYKSFRINGAWQTLGTAATHNVQTSPTDVTSGAVLMNGAWGVGTDAIGMNDSDITSPTSIGCAFFHQGGGDENDYYENYGTGIHLGYGSGAGGTQRMTGNLFIDAEGNLWAHWLAVYVSDGAIAAEGKQKLYGPLNKPTAVDVGALPLAGGTMTGEIKVSSTGHGSYASQYDVDAPVMQIIDSSQASEYWPITKQRYIEGKVAWSSGMIINNGSYVIHCCPEDDTKSKTFNFQLDGTFIPASYANFDARYYTQSAANAKFVQSIQLGAAANMTYGIDRIYASPVGCMMTGILASGSDDTGSFQYKPIQENVNGTWKTISG